MEELKAFEELSERKRFSANARSLYLELIWQFGRTGAGDKLYLSNKELQMRSGIQSSHSYDRARSDLMNAGLIKYKKGVYQLSGNKAETEWKSSGKPVEKTAGVLIVPKNTQEKKIIENKTATTATAANARESSVGQTALSVNSAEVQHEWFLWSQENLKGGETLELIQLENLYGTAKVVEAIHAAGCADTRGKLSINFVKKVLARIVNGGEVTKTARRNAAKVSKLQAVSKYDKEDGV